MRRLARHLFTLCAAASLLLCVAACGLWVRSYRPGDAVSYDRRGRWSAHDRAGLTLARGHVIVGVTENWTAAPEGWRRRDLSPAEAEGVGYMVPRGAWNAAGFWYERGVRTAGPFGPVHRPYWWAAFPLWAPTVVTAICPAVWLAARVRARRRTAAGLCPACGYDLRATPGRCPECGTVATAARPGRPLSTG